jgi:DNA ligase (NAD+)
MTADNEKAPWHCETIAVSSDAFEGLTVVITGKLERMERKEAERLVERAGGNAVGSISGKTDLLVAGDKAGSKLTKAKEMGVDVIDEAAFIARLELVLP